MSAGGSPSILARHDYLPFGEEIAVNVGSRTTTQGYGATDTSRQKYGLSERDDSSGLDHTWFRKYESGAGRWTSSDPLGGSVGNPQTFNRYTYAQNDPVNLVDPTGLREVCYGGLYFGKELGYGPAICFEAGEVHFPSEPKGGIGGVGGRAVPGNKQLTQQKSACEIFVDKLVNASFGTAPTKASAGRVLAMEATYGRFGDAGPLNSGKAPVKDRFRIDGFQYSLVKDNQRGDVYKHVLAHAGAMLLGNSTPDWGLLGKVGIATDWTGKSGYEIDRQETEADRTQTMRDYPEHSSDEAWVELADDQAGREVGNAMGQAMSGKINPAELKVQLMGILCEY
jgi:RHS repeat-associated protein